MGYKAYLYIYMVKYYHILVSIFLTDVGIKVNVHNESQRLPEEDHLVVVFSQHQMQNLGKITS